MLCLVLLRLLCFMLASLYSDLHFSSLNDAFFVRFNHYDASEQTVGSCHRLLDVCICSQISRKVKWRVTASNKQRIWWQHLSYRVFLKGIDPDLCVFMASFQDFLCFVTDVLLSLCRVSVSLLSMCCRVLNVFPKNQSTEFKLNLALNIPSFCKV